MSTLTQFRVVGALCIILAIGYIIASGFLLDASIRFLYDLYYESPYFSDDPFIDWIYYEIAYKMIGTSAAGLFLGALQVIISVIFITDPKRFSTFWCALHAFIFISSVVCFAVAVSAPPADGVKVQAYCGLIGLNFCFLFIIFIFVMYALKCGDEIYIVK